MTDHSKHKFKIVTDEGTVRDLIKTIDYYLDNHETMGLDLSDTENRLQSFKRRIIGMLSR